MGRARAWGEPEPGEKQKAFIITFYQGLDGGGEYIPFPT